MSQTVPHVVYHVACMGNWREVIREQFELLVESGLVSALKECGDTVGITHVGHSLVDVLAEADRLDVPVRVVRSDPNVSHYETFAMLEIERLAKIENTSRPILYMHTKGVSSPDDGIKVKWRKVMGFQVVSKWMENVKLIRDGWKYDAVGFNWWSHGEQHFSGTFWMARADWIRRLPDFVGYHHAKRLERYSCELWIGAAQYCRAYSRGVSNVVTWNGRFDFGPFMPPPKSSVSLVSQRLNAGRPGITWVSAATAGYLSDLNRLAASFGVVANGEDGRKHELVTKVVPSVGTWRHCRKLDILKEVLPSVTTSHVVWIDADCEFVSSLPMQLVVNPKKPLLAVRHFLMSDPVGNCPERMRDRLPPETIDLYWQACLWGGEVAAVSDVLGRVGWINDDERGYDEHALNIEFQHKKDQIHTLPCCFAKPSSFVAMPDHAEKLYSLRSTSTPRVIHHNNEINREFAIRTGSGTL